MAQTVTLSSVGTATLILDPVPRTTSVLISATATSSNASATIEVSLDDPTTTPPPTMTWGALSSAIVSSSTVSVAAFYTVMSPVGGVRLNVSAAGAATTTWTLKALQSVTA